MNISGWGTVGRCCGGLPVNTDTMNKSKRAADGNHSTCSNFAVMANQSVKMLPVVSVGGVPPLRERYQVLHPTMFVCVSVWAFVS